MKLTDKLKNKTYFKWKVEDDNILNTVYKEIQEQHILHYPDISKPYVLESDASERAMESILKQENQIVRIYRTKFNKTEENYSVVEKENLAIVKSLLHFKNIIFNSKIIVKTDNKDLIHIGPISKRLERRKLNFEEYQNEIEYIMGKESASADTLFRLYLINQMKEP
ncbi:Retrovirus-related Pol polyprotein from transposon [Dictyocoela muelleri]|nr:Retrovirus-related Pol polyprotein from transposon [Dictyocoela muelleri]